MGTMIAIVEKTYWKQAKSLQDKHLSQDIQKSLGKDSLNGLEEINESVFLIEETDHDKIHSIMSEKGFIFNKDFSDFIKNPKE